MIRELLYPFDPAAILSQKKKLKRRLLEGGERFEEKRIAILGGSTTHDIRLIMELFLLNQGIRPHFYESGYNQYYQDASFPNKELEAFRPDIIYIHTTNRNVSAYPKPGDDAAEIDAMLESEMESYTGMWDRLKAVYGCPIIQNNFEMPFYRLYGNKDVSDIHGAVNYLARLNMRFYEYAQAHEEFFICDIQYISADYGLKEWSDPFYWYMYKYALNVNAIPYLAFNVANIIKSIFGKNKKGVVLDLDNTLWGGVIGEEGADGIRIGPEDAWGQAYSEFQRYIKAHGEIGAVLSIDSKNEEKNALSGLTHPDSVLKPEDFIVIKANWEPKDQNFSEIAETLSLLPESLLFIDDNPAERHIVSEQLKGVIAPALGEVYQYITLIDRGGYFESTVRSGDDLKRNEMYRENIRRQTLKAAFSDYHEYLLSLGMKAVIRPFEPVYMARIAQLTNKSNQFNLTTRRYTQAELEGLCQRSDYITLYGRLKDRFGDNGIVSVVIGHVEGGGCHIRLWLMSCRVLKRDMEYAMMDRLFGICRERGLQRVCGYYYPSGKNAMVKDFYALQGFQKIGEDEKGNTSWICEIPDVWTRRTDVIEYEEKKEGTET